MEQKSIKTIGVIAPSRPIYTREDEFNLGIGILESWGINIVLSEHIHAHDYYSAGTPDQRADDINKMFADKRVEAIICATGGITSNQILDLLDFEIIKKNPKPLIGYSDNTNLLLAISKMTDMKTFYGPDLCELHNQNPESLKSFERFLRNGQIEIPKEFSTIRGGKGSGELVGGNLFSVCGLLASPYLPTFENKILFWEDTGMSPAHIDFHLNQLKISGQLDSLSAMIIGHLDNCVDNKYPQDNKSIEKIIHEIFKKYDYPVIRVNYFGHEINNFQIIPIGFNCTINTANKVIELT